MTEYGGELGPFEDGTPLIVEGFGEPADALPPVTNGIEPMPTEGHQPTAADLAATHARAAVREEEELLGLARDLQYSVTQRHVQARRRRDMPGRRAR